MSEPLATTVTSLPFNPATAPQSAPSKSHHVLSPGSTTPKKFRNVHTSWNPAFDGSIIPIFLAIVRLRLTGKLPWPSTSPELRAPVVKPTFLPSRTGSASNNNKLRATWLGHACFYVEFPSGLRVLFDPVFESACSPIGFLGPHRYTPPPCQIRDLPLVDAVVISHSHYDHLSSPSIKEVVAAHPNAHFFVGLGLAKWFHRSGIQKVTEMDWWDQAEITLSAGNAGSDSAEIKGVVSCLPCQHSSGRTLRDKDTTLWASWSVLSGGKSVYFAGDTGYRALPTKPPAGPIEDADSKAYGELEYLPGCPSFREIGQFRGPFDLGLIPIGAYKPRQWMSPVHASPEDAVEIFRDTRCQRALGMHWGTWVLTTEEIDEPPKKLREGMKAKGLDEGLFGVVDIGGSAEY
ncbi:N-acyl-phosphatidylethanolamine-hydrolyzing phospholipase D [Cladorrhinum sp. PSN332]|nr:N-acyl-phosphatidylethanolamine-hydrolyzing phospholipase D [Cladorrhinum sp. PSN332]